MSVDYLLTHLGATGRTPTSASTITTSDSSNLTSHAATKAGLLRSSIDINIQNHFKHKVYTSSSPVLGDVTITSKREIRFDSIEILLVGLTKTSVDGVNAPRQVTHTFLKMAMPVPSSAYPVPRILEPGRTCTIPFHFVIPNQLTDGACNHRVVQDRLQDHHVCPPPSVGGWEKDDMAPLMTQVEYVIKARVLRQPDLGQNKVKVMEAFQNLRVLPVSVEQPPLNITKHDPLYKLSHSKTLRKNLLAGNGKLGRLTAEAVQPGAVVLRPDGLAISDTAAHIELQFDPAAADILPPKVTGVSAKVVAHTFYSSSGIGRHPNLGEWMKEFGPERRCAYQTSAGLPPLLSSKADRGPLVRWAQHLSPSLRRDSGYSSAGSDGRDSKKQLQQEMPASPIFHTAMLEVPIDMTALLVKKTPLPTFHSCLTSRVYTLQLSVALQLPGAGTSTVALSLPLQIVVGYGGPEDEALGLPSFEAAVGEAEVEVDEFFRPRVMQVPHQSYLESSSLPGYRGEELPAY